VPYALFVVGSVLSIAASTYVSQTAADAIDAQARAQFVADSDETRRQLEAGLSSYVEVVRTGAVLLAADNEISGAEFRRFVAGLQLDRRYAGLEGIGFAQCVSARDLSRFLRLMESDGNRIRVRPLTPRPTYCPVLFFEPSSTSTNAAIGFDVGAVPTFAEVMVRARDTGEPVASSALQLPGWRGDRRARVALFIPVFRRSGPLQTVDARRRALVGYVVGSLDTEHMLNAIIAPSRRGQGIEVRDGLAVGARVLLDAATPIDPPARFQTLKRVRLADRDWVLTVSSTPRVETAAPPTALQTLVAGLALSLMLLLVSRAQVRAWETSARHEAELHASAQALRESEAEARAANIAKDEFLATVSHELRTPLNVVLGWVNMLRRQSVEPERVPRALEIIERNARQQAQLIDDLLDVSRIVVGQLRLERHLVTLGPLVTAVVESLRPAAEAKRITFAVNTIDESAQVVGDAGRLRQMIWNVITNAIKFTPAGGCVTIALTHSGERIRLTVHDTGVGIEPAFLARVFERFTQADSSTTREHSGVGLGLAIARNLVELHGGTIEARSEGRDRGATFVIELPAAAAATAPAVSQMPVVAAAANPSPLAGVRVLVVDDDESTLELLTTALTSSGAQVIATQSARDALRRVTTDQPDVIVSDIAMPGEDGFWFIEHVRTLGGERGRTPAIALSALARREDRARAIDAGFQRHVAKPVELGELLSHLAALVTESGAWPRSSEAAV
jgi:signal transduction histidine kinase/ActR/RegA family two-component response regulator